jgi:hypothetical protein
MAIQLREILMSNLFHIDQTILEASWRSLRGSRIGDISHLYELSLIPSEQPISDDRLVTMARAIWPSRIERDDNKLRSFIDPGDIVFDNFYDGEWHQSSRKYVVGDASHLAVHGYLITLHERPDSFFCAGPPGYFFRPRAAEILSQIPPEVSRNVVSYESIIFGNDTLEDSLIFGQNGSDPCRYFKVGMTTLFAGKLPEQLAHRPITCRRKIYEAQPKVAA